MKQTDYSTNKGFVSMKQERKKAAIHPSDYFEGCIVYNYGKLCYNLYIKVVVYKG